MKNLLLMTILLSSINSWSHGDHSAQGALPEAPNGGILGEAKRVHSHGHGKHGHEESSKKEVFFEVVKKKTDIKVLAMVLNDKTKEFKALAPSDFKELKIQVFDPRKKKEYQPEFKAAKDSWTLSLAGIKGRRFFIQISGKMNGAELKSSIQVENR